MLSPSSLYTCYFQGGLYYSHTQPLRKPHVKKSRHAVLRTTLRNHDRAHSSLRNSHQAQKHTRADRLKQQDPPIVGAVRIPLEFRLSLCLGDIVIDDVVDEEVDLLARDRLAPIVVGLLDDALSPALAAHRVPVVQGLSLIHI